MPTFQPNDFFTISRPLSSQWLAVSSAAFSTPSTSPALSTPSIRVRRSRLSSLQDAIERPQVRNQSLKDNRISIYAGSSASPPKLLSFPYACVKLLIALQDAFVAPVHGCWLLLSLDRHSRSSGGQYAQVLSMRSFSFVYLCPCHIVVCFAVPTEIDCDSYGHCYGEQERHDTDYNVHNGSRPTTCVALQPRSRSQCIC